MRKAMVILFGLLMGLEGCGAPQERVSDSNTVLRVEYEGKEVHRRGGKYVSELQLRRKLNAGEEIVVIFSAEWCSSCKLLERALKQADLKINLVYVNMDEEWAKQLASIIGFREVPTMLHVDANGDTLRAEQGPGRIVTYLLIQFD